MKTRKNPPTLPLPTSDYYSIVKMSNHAIVGVFRQHVFAVRHQRRFTPTVPEDHDAYCVDRSPDQIVVRIFNNGDEIFRCIFLPVSDY